MTPQMLYILTIASLICSKLSLAAINSAEVDDYYSGVRVEEDLIPCESIEDCIQLPHSKCIDAFCTCPEDIECTKLRITQVFTLGERCNGRDVTCRIDNAHCGDYGVCECDDGYVASAVNNTCLESNRKLGEKCVENAQCYTHFCQNTLCTRQAALGDRCSFSSQCNGTVAFSRCVNNTCNCLERFVEHEGNCYLVAREFLSPCEVDVQCSKIMGAECIRKRCACPAGYTFQAVSRECVLIKNNVVDSSASFKWITFKVIAFSVFIVKFLL